MMVLALGYLVVAFLVAVGFVKLAEYPKSDPPEATFLGLIWPFSLTYVVAYLLFFKWLVKAVEYVGYLNRCTFIGHEWGIPRKAMFSEKYFKHCSECGVDVHVPEDLLKETYVRGG